MKKRWIVYGVVAVLLVLILAKTFGNDDSTLSFEPVSVERGTVAHVVSVTGHVEPVSRVTLAFPMGGRISQLPAAEGLVVDKGAILAGIDDSVAQSALKDAQARLALEQAKLGGVIAPLRSEERAIKDAAVQNARRTLATAEESAYIAIARSFVYADDAVREEADELFSDVRGGSPDFGIEFTYGTTRYTLQADSLTESALDTQRKTIGAMLVGMDERARAKDLPPLDALNATDAELAYIEQFLSLLATVVNRYTSDDTVEQVVYEGFQTSVATARTSINSARADILAATKEYEAADAALVLATRDLDLSVAGASTETITTQEASLRVALAAVDAARERVADGLLIAPIGGTVTQVQHELGETVAPYEPVVELLTEGLFEVEAYIPEADIAKVKLGDSATVTFDAFDTRDVFDAEVVRIALSETVREGVPTYKTTLILLEDPGEEFFIRPGMTVDADIMTDARADVLFVPVRSVVREGDKTFVRVFNGTDFVEKPVETGLRGSAGTIEVTGGLSEGEEIVLFIEEL